MAIFTDFWLHIFFISNLIAQAPDLRLVENLRNLLNNREALNEKSKFRILFPSKKKDWRKLCFLT